MLCLDDKNRIFSLFRMCLNNRFMALKNRRNHEATAM